MQLTPRLYILVLIHWYGNINAETVRESLLVPVIEAINCYRYCIIISLSSDIKKRCHCIRSAWFWIFPGSAKASLHVAYTGIPGARVFGLRWSGGSQVVSSLRPSLGRSQMFIVFALQKDCFCHHCFWSIPELSRFFVSESVSTLIINERCVDMWAAPPDQFVVAQVQ